MPTSSFPLLRLPQVAQRHLLRTMNPVDLFHFCLIFPHFCSTAASWLYGASPCWDVKLELYTTGYFYLFFNHRRHPNDVYVVKGHSTFNPGQRFVKIDGGKVVQFWSAPNGLHFAYEFRHFTHHYLQLLRTARAFFGGHPTSVSVCFPDAGRQIHRYHIPRDLHIRSVTVHRQKRVVFGRPAQEEAEAEERFLAEHPEIECYSLDATSPCQPGSRIFLIRHVEILGCTWFNSGMLKSFKGASLRVDFSKMSSHQVEEFLRLWTTGAAFDGLEVLNIGGVRFDAERIRRRSMGRKWSEQRRKALSEIVKSHNCTDEDDDDELPGFDVRRSVDGAIASCLVSRRNFLFLGPAKVSESEFVDL